MPFEKHDVESLLHEMTYFGVSDALVTHQSALFQPDKGNERLLRDIDGHTNLHPCWVLLPDHTGEVPDANRVIEEMLDKGVRVARLYPDFHKYDLDDFTCGKLLGGLNRHRIPTIISASIGWKEIARLTESYPDIPLILSAKRINNVNRRVYSLMMRSENIFIDLSRYYLHMGIEDICETFSSRRILFGTGYPRSPIVSSMSLVEYAQVDKKDRELIAGDNLRSLMADVKCKTRAKRSPGKDVVPLTEKMRGYCEAETVIDVHGHIGDRYMRKDPGSSPEEVIKVMDLLGIDTMYVSIFPTSMDPAYDSCNDMATQLSRRHGTRLEAYMSLLPGNYPEELEEELSRCYKGGAKGIKLLPQIDCRERPLSDKVYDPVWEFAAAHDLPVLSHSQGTPSANPTQFDRIARDYPDVRFIIGHLGAPQQSLLVALDQCKKVMLKRDNVYAELSAIWLYGPVEEVTKELDTDRLLFGTDAT